MAIHASIVKKAAAHGLEIIEAPGRVEVRKGTQIVGYNGTAKGALQHALTVIEGDRIRNLDDDREPVLIVTGRLPDDHSLVVQKVIKGSIIKSKYRERYKKNGDFSCGDDIADELRAVIAEVHKGKMRVDLAKLKAVAVKNTVWKESYGLLNAGQQRMTIGNRLRAKFKMGEELDIGGAIYCMRIDI